MNEVEEATMFINLSLWQQAVGLIIALIIAIFALWLFIKLRVYIWTRAKYVEGKIAKPLNRNWGVVLLIGALLFFGYIIFVIIFLFGQDKFTEGIVVASAITVFMIFQLPRLLKPHIQITLLPPDEEGETTQLKDMKKPLTSLTLSPSQKHTIHLYISNLGINNYENSHVILTFDNNIDVISKPTASGDLITYDPRNNNILYQTFKSFPYGPDDNLILSQEIRTPSESGEYILTVTLKCANRWGETEKELKLNVKEHSS